MPEDHYWPEFDSDRLTPPEPAPEARPAQLDTLLDAPLVLARPRSRRTRIRFAIGRVLLGIGLAIVAFVVLYTADLLLSAGTVPRGVTVAGVDIGGVDREEAETLLRKEIEPRMTQPVVVRAGDVDARLDPAVSGLGLDWAATIERAGTQPLDPGTRLASFFTTREVGVVTTSDPDQLKQAVSNLVNERLNHDLTEGTIRFESAPGIDGGVRPVAVNPRQKQTVADLDGAIGLIRAGWLNPGGVQLPVDISLPKATPEGVRASMTQIVEPTVELPLHIRGEGRDAVLKPEVIAGAMRFTPVDGGALEVRLDPGPIQSQALSQLGETERPAKDAQIVFSGNLPSVRPSEEGRRIAWEPTLAPFMEAVKRTDVHELRAVYETAKPRVTTEAANALGIREVIGEFSTGDLAPGSTTNVRNLAGKLSGAIVRPGETFSLDGHTGPRSASQGYVRAPVHEDGTGPVVFGGGISQLTSTLYNAVYFAGLAVTEAAPHDHYLPRFPPARDAKSLQESGAGVDFKFTNDAPTGVAVQADVAGGQVTVKIWGTRHYRVASSTGPPTNPVDPPVRAGGPGRCVPSPGTPGFSISDTRVLYDAATGTEVRRDSRTVTYQPRPRVVCV